MPFSPPLFPWQRRQYFSLPCLYNNTALLPRLFIIIPLNIVPPFPWQRRHFFFTPLFLWQRRHFVSMTTPPYFCPPRCRSVGVASPSPPSIAPPRNRLSPKLRPFRRSHHGAAPQLRPGPAALPRPSPPARRGHRGGCGGSGRRLRARGPGLGEEGAVGRGFCGV